MATPPSPPTKKREVERKLKTFERLHSIFILIFWGGSYFVLVDGVARKKIYSFVLINKNLFFQFSLFSSWNGVWFFSIVIKRKGSCMYICTVYILFGVWQKEVYVVHMYFIVGKMCFGFFIFLHDRERGEIFLIFCPFFLLEWNFFLWETVFYLLSCLHIVGGWHVKNEGKLSTLSLSSNIKKSIVFSVLVYFFSFFLRLLLVLPLLES